MRESTVEAGLVAFAKKNGIWTRKFSSPAHRGVPDRIFIHMGKVLFLEVKRPGEKPTQLQEHELQLIRNAGGMAAWVDSVELGIVTLRHYLMPVLINPFDPEQQDELTAELQRGEDAARQLVEYLIRMGAANVVMPVLINDEKYTIRVAHEPAKADAL